VEVVMLAEKRGSEDDKKRLAAEFLAPEVEDVADAEENSSSTNEQEEKKSEEQIIEENRQRLGIKPVNWTAEEVERINRSSSSE
jgi:hypothetical protein